jgi:hypothetical protein
MVTYMYGMALAGLMLVLYKVLQALKVHKVLLDLQVLAEFKVLVDQQDLKVNKALQALKVHKVLLDLQVLAEFKVCKV